MDNVLDIRSLNRINKELKSMDRYFESIQKRTRNLGLSNFQRQKVAIDRTTESVKRFSNALSDLTTRLYKINRLTGNLSGIKIAVKCSCSKDCSKCKSTNHSKMGGSNWLSNPLIKPQNKIITQRDIQNKVSPNNPAIPSVPLKTSTPNNPNKSVNSQSSANKKSEKEKIVLLKPVVDTMAFLKKFNTPNDIAESLIETSKAYKAITPTQVAAMPPWLQSTKAKVDGVLDKIKASTAYTKAASVYSSAPPWLKTGLKGAWKVAKRAAVVADIGYEFNEISNATGEDKYKKIGEFVGGKLGNVAGKSLGGLTALIPYVGPVIAPLASFVAGELGDWLGKMGGGKIMEGVWYAKTHLKGWTESLKSGTDIVTRDFKQGMDGFNNEVDNKTNTINAIAPPLIDYSSKQFAGFIGNQTQDTMEGIDDLSWAISIKLPGSSELLNKMKEPLKNKVYDAGNYLKNNIPGLSEGIKSNVLGISEGTKNFSNGLNKFIQKNADPVKETVKKATSKTSDFLQMILDSPEKVNWELLFGTEKTAARKVPNKSSRNLIASSRTYRTNDRHRKTAVHSVKNSNKNTSNMQVNMPTGAIQVAVGERVNFDALASEVGKRFVAGFRQAMDNNKTARA